MTSGLQYRVVRNHLHQDRSWIPLSIAGWVLGLILAGVVFALTLAVADSAVNFTFGLALGFGIGLGQYFVLRRHLSRSGYWILAKALSWALVILGADLISRNFAGAGQDPSGSLVLAVGGACIAFLLATIFVAAVLGLVMIRLVRQTGSFVSSNGS